jgi:hypothetical protein
MPGHQSRSGKVFPDDVRGIKEKQEIYLSATPVGLHALFENKQVQDVIKGGNVGGPLDEETIRRCAGLCS